MKKRLLLVLCSLIIISMFTGCGNNSKMSKLYPNIWSDDDTALSHTEIAYAIENLIKDPDPDVDARVDKIYSYNKVKKEYSTFDCVINQDEYELNIDYSSSEDPRLGVTDVVFSPKDTKNEYTCILIELSRNCNGLDGSSSRDFIESIVKTMLFIDPSLGSAADVYDFLLDLSGTAKTEFKLNGKKYSLNDDDTITINNVDYYFVYIPGRDIEPIYFEAYIKDPHVLNEIKEMKGN